jgi:hypothetical protein
MGTVRLPSLDRDGETITGSHNASWAYGETPGCGEAAAGEDVDAEYRVDLRRIERTLRDHQLRSAFLTGRWPFFGRLKQEDDRPRQLRLHRAQNGGGAQQHRGMRIVAAGVHHANALAVVLRRDGGLEGDVHLLRDRQRVHVGPQRDHRAGTRAPQHGDHARLRHALAHFEREAFQLGSDDARRPHLTVPKLRVLVQVTAPGDHLCIDIGGSPIDFLMDPGWSGDLLRLRVCRNRADEGGQPEDAGVESQADGHP